MVLVRRGHDGERVALRPVAEPRAAAAAIGEWSSTRMPCTPFGRERDPARVARGAGTTAGRREERDERLRRAALDARLEMGHVPGHPQQLQLEREHDGIERGARAGPRRSLVERVEEARQRREGLLVRLLLGEEPQHRLEPDHPDLEPVGIRADAVVRADERRAGDGVELAAALVEDELDVGERLQAGTEARLRLADALRDRADASPLVRVDVQDAVGLAEPEGAEHDRFGRGRAGHGSSVRVAMAGAAMARACGAAE